jgi:GDP-L-fucose synthase
MELNSKIYVAGHRGLVGSAIVRILEARGHTNILLRSSAELDLRRQEQVEDFFNTERPDYVFLAAAKVGGIVANNTYPAEFIYNNLMIQTNIIHSAFTSLVKKLLFLGSTCIYPKHSQQPMKESYLLGGPLEPTNEAYAIAKIAGIKMCQAYNRQYGTCFISAMPTNLYGPNDNFDLANSHVLPAMMRKFHEAKSRGDETVTIWGTGTPYREFVHVDDVASGCYFLMQNYRESEIVNIGTGHEISISDLARLIGRVVGFSGAIEYDTSRPDGTPRKLSDVSKIHSLGWRHQIELEEGIRSVYRWYVNSLTTWR